jgi:hypothetical protein
MLLNRGNIRGSSQRTLRAYFILFSKDTENLLFVFKLDLQWLSYTYYSFRAFPKHILGSL